MNANELELRLIKFAISIIKFLRRQPNDIVFIPLKKQLIRSCTSPAMNYGESRGAESRRDFVHKLKIVLKELRETNITLRIFHGLIDNSNELNELLKESNELISIFVASTKSLDSKGRTN